MLYQITETREFYGPCKETTVLTGYFGEPEVFASRREALARIDELDNGPYITGHNEISRPCYKVKRA